jgi:Protein of unknown function (DUF2442)
MSWLRISKAEPLDQFRLRLTLTDGSVVERDVKPLLRGPVFEKIRSDPGKFAQVLVRDGSIVWPNGADLCPDVLIWNGLPPEDEARFPSAEPQPKSNSGR